MEEEKQAKAIQMQMQLEQQLKGGASWFYWIAGLSLINTVLLLTGSDWSFVVGLGITQIISGIGSIIAEKVGFAGTALAFVLSFIVAGTFVLFGVFANKRHLWAFIAGMVLYALDGMLFLLIPDWLSIGFHVFVLFCIFTGLKARGRLIELEKNTASTAEQPVFSAEQEQAPV